MKWTLKTISDKVLMDREQVADGGQGQLQPGTKVYVTRDTPLECDPAIAARVLQNMKHGIDYHYFFVAAEVWAQEISRLVYALSTAALNYQNTLDDELRARLNTLRARLHIHFVPSKPPFEYCVHNAGSHSARCYLHLPNGKFLEWHTGEDAQDIMKALEHQAPDESSTSADFIFRVTPDERQMEMIRALQGTIRKMCQALRTEIRRLFDPKAPLEKFLEKVCFGSAPGGSDARQPGKAGPSRRQVQSSGGRVAVRRTTTAQKQRPGGPARNVSIGATRAPRKVCIVCSAQDKRRFESLWTHLDLLTHLEIEIWDKTKIPPGADRHAEIQKALSAAQVAILLVSVNLLASKDLSLLLEAEKRGCRIIPIMVRDCSLQDSPLANFQFLTLPGKPPRPLITMKPGEQDQIFIELFKVIKLHFEKDAHPESKTRTLGS